jgi:DNA-binding transcriptional MerR regulator
VFTVSTEVIPNRPFFRAQEVCEIADVQPYVLRTWEAEFPDLGVPKTPNGPRLYRRADVERVLRIKHLILVDGLTLAGARRQLGAEPVVDSAAPDAGSLAAFADGELQKQLHDVRRGLQWIMGVLSTEHVALPAPAPSGAGRRKTPVRAEAGPRAAPKPRKR